MTKAVQILLSPITIGCALLMATPAGLAAPSDPDWKEFAVPDFGTRVEYPAGIFSVSEGKSEVGTGERLSTADKRASLTIYTRANEAGETPDSYLRISVLHGAAIHCFDLVYPKPEKRAWDAIVTRISLSLRPLRG